MDRVTGRVGLIGAGFPAIGPGVITVTFGFTDTIGPVNQIRGRHNRSNSLKI